MAIISISDSQVNGANQILVADGSSKIPAKDGSQITILNATNVSSGTIASARLDTGTTAGKLVVLDGSGNLPAVDASLLTGIVSATISASDPTISTNPSGGVGTEWNNSTSGAMYICTDATAGANVWTNVGGGSGNIVPHSFPGTIAGFMYGGYNHPNAARTAGIDRVSFTTDGNSTDIGNMAAGNPGRSATAGTSSATHGFCSGGYGPGAFSPNTSKNIERFPMSQTSGTMIDVGDLVHEIRDCGSSCNADYGICHGGYRAVSDPSGPATGYNIIFRYQHAASSDATDHGDLTTEGSNPSGHSDPGGGYGYRSCGYHPPIGAPGTNIIDRYSFSSSGNAADVGDMTVSAVSRAGCSSETHGYGSGYTWSPSGTPSFATIDKFAFGSSSNATDVGDLTVPFSGATGVSSTTHGYSLGGAWLSGDNSGQGSNRIEKYSFSTNGNSTDIGDLITHTSTSGTTGSQY